MYSGRYDNPKYVDRVTVKHVLTSLTMWMLAFIMIHVGYEFDIDKKDTVGVRVDRKRRQMVSTFLRALDFAQTDEEILDLFDGSQLIRNTLEKDPTEDRDEALLDSGFRAGRSGPT